VTVYKAGQPAEELITFTHHDTGETTQMPITKYLGREYRFVHAQLRNGDDPDPIHTMYVFRLFVDSELPIPADLRKWFVSRIDTYMDNEGEKTLGSVFGFTGGECEKGEFTKKKKDHSDHLTSVMDFLIHITDLRPTSAARLVLWRSRTPETQLKAKYLAGKYTDLLKDEVHQKIRKGLYLHNGQDSLKKNLKFLQTFTKDQDVFDRDNFAKETPGHIDEVLLVISKLQKLTPEAYYAQLAAKQ